MTPLVRLFLPFRTLELIRMIGWPLNDRSRIFAGESACSIGRRQPCALVLLRVNHDARLMTQEWHVDTSRALRRPALGDAAHIAARDHCKCITKLALMCIVKFERARHWNWQVDVNIETRLQFDYRFASDRQWRVWSSSYSCLASGTSLVIYTFGYSR